MSITCGQIATVSADGTIQGPVSAGGDVFLFAGETITSEHIDGDNVTVTAGGLILLAELTARTDATVSGLSDVVLESASAGRDFTVAGNVVLVSGPASDPFGENAGGTDPVAGRDFVGQATEFVGDIGDGRDLSVLSAGAVTGAMDAGGAVEVTALGEDATGSVKDGGIVLVSAAGNVFDQVTGGLDVTVQAGDGVGGPVDSTGGAATVVALGGGVEEWVRAGKNVTVIAAENVSKEVTALDGDINVVVLGSALKTVRASNSATVSAWDAVAGDVTAVAGSASVFGFSGVTGATEAGLDATASTGPGGPVSGTVKAGRDATVTTWGSVTGAILAGRDVDVWTGDGIDTEVGAGRDLRQ